MELKVTAAAVGQLVRSLETWLGAPLFERVGSGSRRLTPMPEMQAALADLTDGFDRIEAGLARLDRARGRDLVVVTASQALVAKWLMPRLHAFNHAHSGTELGST